MTTPEIGQVWIIRARHRYVRITDIDRATGRVAIRTAVKEPGPRWIVVGRKSSARLSSFDGAYHHYTFLENPPGGGVNAEH
jgi:hypothetical protein